MMTTISKDEISTTVMLSGITIAVVVGSAVWSLTKSKNSCKENLITATTGAKDSESLVTSVTKVKSISDPIGLGQQHPAAALSQNEGCVYLDYNATTPIYPEVSSAILPFITTCFGNPSSPHVYSKPCREAVAKARKHVGLLVNATAKTIYFTSCGTESDNRAIDIAIHHFHSSDEQNENVIPRIITTAIEHPAILAYLNHLKKKKQIELIVVNVSRQVGKHFVFLLVLSIMSRLIQLYDFCSEYLNRYNVLLMLILHFFYGNSNSFGS